MKIRALFAVLALSFAVVYPVHSKELPPKVAVAYDIGFLGDNSYNDAVHEALAQAKKKYKLVEPFVREIPTNGTPMDRLTRLRFLAKNGYTLIITVGSGYREPVKRVSMEYPQTQFAIINDRTLGQLNISNVYFNENDSAYLAGVIAALNSKRKSIGFVGSDPDSLKSFARGASQVSKKVKVVNILYPSEITELKNGLQKVDVVYSTWDRDARVLTTIIDLFPKKVKLIVETPDQYFAKAPSAEPVILATIEKNLVKPIDQLVAAALQNRALIDVLDDSAGIYGREFNASNGGIRVTTSIPTSSTLRNAISKALIILK